MRTHAMGMLLLAASVVALPAADPVLGTWKLDPVKSRFRPGPAPAEQTRIYESGAEGVKVSIVTTFADGTTTTIEHPANFDGKDYPVTGSRRAVAISLKKIDDRTSESILKHAGKVIGHARREVSEDGKTMTVSYKGIAADGREVDNEAFYRRE